MSKNPNASVIFLLSILYPSFQALSLSYLSIKLDQGLFCDIGYAYF